MGSIFIKLKFQENFNAEFDGTTGVSTVTFNNKYGKFTGKARLNPADSASQFKGCHIAEARANIVYYKTVIRYSKEKVKLLTTLYKQEPTDAIKHRLAFEEEKLEKCKEDLRKEQLYLDNYLAGLDKNRVTREDIMAAVMASSFGQN